MNWLKKARPALIVIGLGLAMGSLIGARALTNGHSTEANAQPGAPRAAGGPIVLGTVDTDPQPIAYGLPPVLQSGSVAKVFVKDGDEVKAGQELYVFDTRIQKEDVKRAEAAVVTANTKLNEAKTGIKYHEESKKDALLAVQLAEKKVKLNADYYNLVKSNLETHYRTEKYPEADWERRMNNDSTLFKARVDYETASGERDLAKRRLEHLESIDPDVKVKEAEAGVKQAQAEQDKAQAAVDLCTVRAKTAGTIEQVSISAGTTLGISTRAPALWLIPAGPRVVRAEVEADFAHRVGADLKDKTVTIYDHTNSKLTYSGTVTRIGTSFLLKRSSADNLLGNDTRVIEVVVEVTDPTPPGKPPLRVGQRVRVSLGQ